MRKLPSAVSKESVITFILNERSLSLRTEKYKNNLRITFIQKIIVYEHLLFQTYFCVAVFITLYVYVSGISKSKHHSEIIKYRKKYEQMIRNYPIIELSVLPQGCKLNVDNLYLQSWNTIRSTHHFLLRLIRYEIVCSQSII